MFGVNSGVCLGFDKWLGYDVVIMGAWALGISFQSCHLRVCLLTLGFFNAGASVFEWWCFSVSVAAVDRFCAGCLFHCWNSGTAR